MSRRRRFIKKPSKYENEAVVATTIIQKIEIQNQFFNDKYKTVFYAKSKNIPEGRMCIVWGRTTFQEGDEITITGRIKDDVFLVWKYLYKSLTPKEAN